MDSFVVDKLTQWQLTDLVDSFKDEGIDEESFLLLDEGTIKQLIPKAGPRLKFLKNFSGFSQDIRQILTGSTEGKLILESLDEENVITIKQRRCLVRILVSHLVEKFGDSPTSETKKSLATALIQAFPCLKDESSSGTVSN
ncbi:uncharacterized protein LOC144463739 [Epinephelus lanceolatus]